MSEHDGGAAFPYSALAPDAQTGQLVGQMYADSRGMTLRDYFAGQALAGILARMDPTANAYVTRTELAYQYADLMLAEREK